MSAPSLVKSTLFALPLVNLIAVCPAVDLDIINGIASVCDIFKVELGVEVPSPKFPEASSLIFSEPLVPVWKVVNPEVNFNCAAFEVAAYSCFISPIVSPALLCIISKPALPPNLIKPSPKLFTSTSPAKVAVVPVKAPVSVPPASGR